MQTNLTLCLKERYPEKDPARLTQYERTYPPDVFVIWRPKSVKFRQ